MPLVLASILPGFRQVRTPLVVGGLYLLVLWLWLGPGKLLPNGHSPKPVEARLASLVDAVGPGVTLAAVALVAYLLGSFATIRWWPKGVRATKKVNKHTQPLAWTREATEWAAHVWDQFERLGGDLTFHDLRTARMLPYPFIRRIQQLLLEDVEWKTLEYQDDDGQTQSITWNARDHYPLTHDPFNAALTLQVVFTEHALLAETLRAKDPVLFAEYDRVQSEAELRYSLIPPVVLVVLTLCVLWSWWFLPALLVVGLLIQFGQRLEREARQRIATALRVGVIESPTAQTLLNLEWIQDPGARGKYADRPEVGEHEDPIRLFDPPD